MCGSVHHGPDAQPLGEVVTVGLRQPKDSLERFHTLENCQLSNSQLLLKGYSDDRGNFEVGHHVPVSSSRKLAVPEEVIEADTEVSHFLSQETLKEEDVTRERDNARQVVQNRTLDTRPRNLTIDPSSTKQKSEALAKSNRPRAPRTLSTPASVRSPINFSQDTRKARSYSRSEQPKPRALPSPQPSSSSLSTSIPLPPLSLSTYLQYELAPEKVPSLVLHRPDASDSPYESSRVKIERLLNFLLLPIHLEGCLLFGVLVCLDCWLYVFTILPLRVVKSSYMLFQTLLRNTYRETRYILSSVVSGTHRIWTRRRELSSPPSPEVSRTSSEVHLPQEKDNRSRSRSYRNHKRVKSLPSNLQSSDKADVLKGALIVCTCLILLRLDASRMYHWVRGQAAIKLYVIYNLLEVCDRLLSALGQDVLECLFSREVLERKQNGRSKVLRPLWLFAVALLYSVVHSTALFYQVVTLNVAVNSYSNALITLLLSNQFVEIKGTVFKKFEKENLFQITCSDIVERFQLWHMLLIIASRNIVETGGFSIGLPTLLDPTVTMATAAANVTHAAPPRMASSILPSSFNIVPSMLTSMSAYVPTVSHVLGPFVIVLGSEMAIDWLKHAYIGKFNNVRPVIYGRFLDVLTRDYYSNAFGNQNLIKRLGLPIIPLSCLMIRAGFQTYQMLVASWVPTSHARAAASLTEMHRHYSASKPASTSLVGMLVRKMDDGFNHLPDVIWSAEFTSRFTTTLVFLLMFLVLLVVKLMLGISLLAFSRARYTFMKEREQFSHRSYHVEGGKRVGGWGVVEVDDEKRQWIYEDDAAGLQAIRQREAKDKGKREQEKKSGFGTDGLDQVIRYDMVAKRIW